MEETRSSRLSARSQCRLINSLDTSVVTISHYLFFNAYQLHGSRKRLVYPEQRACYVVQVSEGRLDALVGYRVFV